MKTIGAGTGDGIYTASGKSAEGYVIGGEDHLYLLNGIEGDGIQCGLSSIGTTCCQTKYIRRIGPVNGELIILVALPGKRDTHGASIDVASSGLGLAERDVYNRLYFG